MRDTTAMVAAATVVGSAGLATAQQFDDRMAFEAAAADQNIALDSESFEGLPITGSAAESEFTLPAFTVSAVNEGFEFLPPLGIEGLTGGGGTFATDGDQHLNVGSLFNTGQNNDVVVTFQFETAINALFLDITDLRGLDQAPNPRAFLETGAGDAITLLDGQQNDQDLLTVGLISDSTFDTVTIRATAGDSFGIDAVSFGVPTPGTAALLGLGGLSASRRRR